MQIVCEIKLFRRDTELGSYQHIVRVDARICPHKIIQFYAVLFSY